MIFSKKLDFAPQSKREASFSQVMLSSLIIADKFRPNVQGTTQILPEELWPVCASKTWCEYPYQARRR
jgi:hypothetical protein